VFLSSLIHPAIWLSLLWSPLWNFSFQSFCSLVPEFLFCSFKWLLSLSWTNFVHLLSSWFCLVVYVLF
jgi:hypothetical protein